MKKSLIVKAICLLNLFFFAGIIKAQTPKMERFPATELGQEIIIDQDDELWAPLWETSEVSRAEGQAILDAGGDPCNRPTCSGNVCCITVVYWPFGTNDPHFVTTCWDNRDGAQLAKIAH